VYTLAKQYRGGSKEGYNLKFRQVRSWN
jgi:hypothetical protein